jgi:hypothetical protein
MMSEPEFIAATAALNRDNLGAHGAWQRYAIRQLISNDRRLGGARHESESLNLFLYRRGCPSVVVRTKLDPEPSEYLYARAGQMA